MVLTKQYLRYDRGPTFNLIATANCNALFVKFRQLAGHFVACGAIDAVYVWDIRSGEKVATLKGTGSASSQVTVIAKSPDSKFLTAGYRNGTFSVFNLSTAENIITFSGHSSEVTCLVYDNSGQRIATGSKDTDIVIWDAVSESGLFRLKGHKDVVTCCRFLQYRNVLVSCSKDTFIKFWDLDTVHCFKTMRAHDSEVWHFTVSNSEDQIITCSADKALKFWNIAYTNEQSSDAMSDLSAKEKGSHFKEDEDDYKFGMQCHLAGYVRRTSRNPAHWFHVDEERTLLACPGNAKSLEIFRFLSDKEQSALLSKKKKKLSAPESTTKDGEAAVHLTAEETVLRIGVLSASSKIKSFDFFVEKTGMAKFIILLNDNSLELWDLQYEPNKCEGSLKYALKVPGHRTDVRTLCFSSDNTALLSASAEALKIWNTSTQQCIRTIICEYALCSMFVPGDRHCIIGTKSGKLQIFDIAGSVLLESIQAHDGAVWSVSLHPDQRSFVSGGADKVVKFWQFELIDSVDSKSKRLTASHTRTLKLTDDVICVKFSYDGRLLAVSTLDSTVKIFFTDTLKFFLSLYGHKFPVLCMDISDDNTLIVTGSTDRNIKIWGLDFGDCHKSIFAHDDSVMCLQFIPKTHMVFTGGKDGAVKQWDSDNFQRICTLKIHHAEVWSLAVSPNGHYVASSSHDKSICLLQKTDEILILDEERESEREQTLENDLVIREEIIEAGGTNPESGVAALKTGETIGAIDKILDALHSYKEEIGKLQSESSEDHPKDRGLTLSALHPTLVASGTCTPEQFIINVMKQIKPTDIKEGILLLSFMDVIELLNVFSLLLRKEWNLELICNCVLQMLRMHHGQILLNHTLLPLVDELRRSVIECISNMKDLTGFNLAGLKFLTQESKILADIQTFSEPMKKTKAKKKRRNEAIAKQRILLSM